jgi:hypothetical protein
VKVKYKYYRGTLATWDDLFAQAAEFATKTGWDRVISISHSCAGQADGVVTVWYWEEEKQDG